MRFAAGMSRHRYAAPAYFSPFLLLLTGERRVGWRWNRRIRAGLGVRGSSPSRQQRNEHRHAPTIFDMGLAVEGDEVALPQQDADDDVAGCRDREQKMSHRHRRCRPEGQHKAEIDRVANELVEQGCLEARRLHRLALPMRLDLLLDAAPGQR